MTNTLNAFRNEAVGFIDWLDAGLDYPRGAGVGRGSGVGRGLGVALAVAVAVAVGVGDGVGLPGGSLGVGTEWQKISMELSGVPSLA